MMIVRCDVYIEMLFQFRSTRQKLKQVMKHSPRKTNMIQPKKESNGPGLK